MDNCLIRSAEIDWARVDGESYLHDIGALRRMGTLRFDRAVTFFAGENGTGKSTLLEALAVACGFNAEGGTRNYRFQTYDDVSELSDALKVIRGWRRQRGGFFFRAESFFNVATVTLTDYNDDGKMPDYHARSHGESFLEYLQGADRNGLYLMDEPEAALSPQRQLTLLLHIARMAEAGAQFIIASHSPILLGLPGAAILRFSEAGVERVAYEETESYQVTKLFLENRESLLHKLLSEE